MRKPLISHAALLLVLSCPFTLGGLPFIIKKLLKCCTRFFMYVLPRWGYLVNEPGMSRSLFLQKKPRKSMFSGLVFVFKE
jgi:hypothetical protein